MTLTSSSFAVLFITGLVVAVAAASATLWRRRVPGLPVVNAVRAALYVSRYKVALEYYGLGRAEIASHVDALRGDLTAVDPAEIDAALRRLGPPRTLAADMSHGTLRPSMLRGAVWFGAALLLTIGISILTADALLGGFEPVAEPGQRVSWSAVGLHVEATMGSTGRAATIEFGGYALMILPATAFVTGARLWRLLQRSQSASRTTPL